MKFRLLRYFSLFTILLFSTHPSFSKSWAWSSGLALGWQAAPAISTTGVLLTISGEVASPLKLTAADFAKLPRRSVKAKDHDGKECSFEGVLLIDVLKLAGLTFGESLRGKRLATYLLVGAADGYQAVFALPELDPAFTDRLILLADRQNGAPLLASAGPLQIIIPDEKRHARYVRQVTSLTVRRAYIVQKNLPITPYN